MRIQRRTIALGVVAGGSALLWSGALRPDKAADLLTQAQAIRGRPLTPLSYAGVARRTTRRAVAAGAAVGAAYYAPACVRVVDAYGRVHYRCPLCTGCGRLHRG
jgi:hypothetical protein